MKFLKITALLALATATVLGLDACAAKGSVSTGSTTTSGTMRTSSGK